jgi:hypothetical protein
MMRFLKPKVFATLIPLLELRVPVTATPVEVTATTVVPLLFKLRMPEASPVIEMPPAPLVRAAIVDAIYISPLMFTR